MRAFTVLLSVLISMALLSISLLVGPMLQLSVPYLFALIIVGLGLVALVLFRTTDPSMIDADARQVLRLGRHLVWIGGSATVLMVIAYFLFTGSLP